MRLATKDEDMEVKNCELELHQMEMRICGDCVRKSNSPRRKITFLISYEKKNTF